jgi:hypothetical protein
MIHLYIKQSWVHYPTFVLRGFLQGLTSMTTNLNLNRYQHLAYASHVGSNPAATASHVGEIDTAGKPRRIGHIPKFPCNICEG